MSSKLIKSKCDLPKSFQRSNFSCNRKKRSACTIPSCTCSMGRCTASTNPCTGLDPMANLLQLTALIRAASFLDLTVKQDAATQTNQNISSPERKRRKRKRRKGSRERKKKKRKREKRGRKHCASPSYSDYEPENPFLRNRNK